MNDYSIDLFCKNSENKADELINYQLFDIALAAKYLFTDSTYNIIIKTETSKNMNKCAELNHILNRIKSLKTDNHYLLNLEKVLNNIRLSYSNNRGSCKRQVEYIPSIYFINKNTADITKTPIIAVSTELNTEILSGDFKGDYIPAWYFDKNRKEQKIILNEEIVSKLRNPVFIVDNALNESNVSSITNNKYKKSKTSVKQIIDKYKISYRYDKSKRSEYSYVLAYIYTNGTYDILKRREEIKEIHKDDIDKLFDDDFNIWQIQSFNNLESINLVSFEYDWYASRKPVMTSGNITVTCKMKNIDEYYQILHIPINQNFTESYSKGYIKIKKQL